MKYKQWSTSYTLHITHYTLDLKPTWLQSESVAWAVVIFHEHVRGYLEICRLVYRLHKLFIGSVLSRRYPLNDNLPSLSHKYCRIITSRMNRSDSLHGVEIPHHNLRRVRFYRVQIREYEKIPWDHKGRSGGSDRALGSSYRDLEAVDVLKYEQLREKRRSCPKMKLCRVHSSRSPSVFRAPKSVLVRTSFRLRR